MSFAIIRNGCHHCLSEQLDAPNERIGAFLSLLEQARLARNSRSYRSTAALTHAADQALLRDCRTLVLAMVAAWRWDPGDEFPNGRRAAHKLLSALREGPPWPALDVVMRD